MQAQAYGLVLFYYNNDLNKPIRRLFIDRVLDECVKWSGNCLLWVGSVGGGEQPQMNVTYKTNVSGNVPVSRLMYQYENGAVDSSVHIFRQCFNKRCVNPKHYKIRR
jgi:hypothetical protein